MVVKMRRKGNSCASPVGMWNGHYKKKKKQTVWQFLKELKIDLSYDPAISLLGM